MMSTQTANHTQLADWLYEEGSEFANPVSVTRFDRLDFVFVYGDPAVLPWMKEARQVRLLVKMCYLTGKATFCCGFGGQLLAYIAATGGREIVVTNGSGKGGYLKNISHAAVPVHHTVTPLAFQPGERQ